MTTKEAIPTSNGRAEKIVDDIHKLLRFHGGVFPAPVIRDMVATELRMYAADVCLLREANAAIAAAERDTKPEADANAGQGPGNATDSGQSV